MAFFMDVFTKQPLVARKHVVEDSEDINTEYLPHFAFWAVITVLE